MTLHFAYPIYKNKLIAGLCCCLISVSAIGGIDDQISGMQSEITRQEIQLKNKNEQLDSLQSQLKSQEQSINSMSKKIRNIYSNLSILADEIETLNEENAQLEKEKKNKLAILEHLLVNQYRQGKHAPLSAILGSQQTHHYDRMTTYVETLSKDHAETISSLIHTDKELTQRYEKLKQQTERQNTLLADLQSEKKQLEKQQKKREATAKRIKSQIKNDTHYLVELRDNEKRLQKELQLAKEQAALEEKQKQVKMNGLAKHKGSLKWPVKGDILHTYGSPQTGQLRWNGIVISAKEGSEVKATHSGTVVLSNWLRGYGLMVVIDHGKGDMSFYGYNQTLLRNVGDRVVAGEPIALVGNSGGQTSPGLYFEVRRKGNAINPTPWLIQQ